MHNRHLAGCGLMLAVALGFLVMTGESSAGLGLVLVALICPLAMILGIKLLLGERESAEQHQTDQTQVETHDTTPR